MDEQEPASPAPAAKPSPFFLGLVGLALAIGGWKLSTWTPPRSVRSEGLFYDVRGMADDSELRQRLDSFRQSAASRPPLELPGRLAFVFGVGVFVLAVARMSRMPAAAEESIPIS